MPDLNRLAPTHVSVIGVVTRTFTDGMKKEATASILRHDGRLMTVRCAPERSQVEPRPAAARQAKLR